MNLYICMSIYIYICQIIYRKYKCDKKIYTKLYLSKINDKESNLLLLWKRKSEEIIKMKIINCIYIYFIIYIYIWIDIY